MGVGKTNTLHNLTSRIKKELFRHPDRKSNVRKSGCSQIFSTIQKSKTMEQNLKGRKMGLIFCQVIHVKRQQADIPKPKKKLKKKPVRHSQKDS